jgi:hypothetical protein
VDKRSTTLGFNYTVVPVIMHVIGVGSTVLLKFIYEMSEGIGHLEKMCVDAFFGCHFLLSS